MAAPAADPYSGISAEVFRLTFDALLQRPDFTPEQRKKLEDGKAAFLRSGGVGKAQAMQQLLSAQGTLGDNLVVSTMSGLIRAQHQHGMHGASRPPMTSGAMAMNNTAAATNLGKPMAGAAPGGTTSGQAAGAGTAGGVGGEDDLTVEGPAEADALAGAGVNLAEQEALMNRVGKMRTLKDTMPQLQEEYVLEPRALSRLLTRVTSRQGLAGVDPACVSFLTQAVEAHLSRLLLNTARVQVQRNDLARQYEGVMPVIERKRKRDGLNDIGNGFGGAHSTPTAEGGADAPGTWSQHQLHLVFHKKRALLKRRPAAVGERFVALVRQLDPTRTLATPVLIAAATADGRGSTAGGSATTPAMTATLELPDLVAALEKDPLLSRHPILWRLHQKLAS